MKTTVVVTLRCEAVVTMEVERKKGDDPYDLTKEECARARKLAGVDSSWDIADVEAMP